MKVMIIGSGWAGASAHYLLKKLNVDSELFESRNVVGGHSRSEKINGVIYEPNGPHIFHTSNKLVNDFVNEFGMKRKYSHQIKSRIYPKSLKGESILLSWPPQVSELKQLKEWKDIEDELNNLPDVKNKNNFQDYAISIMGQTLYELFIEGYTVKQWGKEPNKLSAEFAPKRIDLRNDGNRNIFKDRWEYFHPEGSGEIIENILSKATVNFNNEITINNIDSFEPDFDAVIMTSSLDLFLDHNEKLEWRGIESKAEFYTTSNNEDKFTEAYQINHPSLNDKFTRTIETKHASGQLIDGTVVCKEYPVSGLRHYPVLNKEDTNTKLNNKLKEIINKNVSLPVFFCGRLANYQYINQDEAIVQGFTAAENLKSYFK